MPARLRDGAGPSDQTDQIGRVSQLELEGVTFDAAFDGGNLARVDFRTSDGTFILKTAPDSAGTRYENNSRSWFCFSVRGASLGAQSLERGRVLRFELRGLNNLDKLYAHDMRPVVRALPSRPEWAAGTVNEDGGRFAARGSVS